MKARRALPWYLWVLLAGGLLTLAPLWMPLLLAAWFARLVQPIVDGLSRKLGSRHPGIILSLGLFVLMIVPVTAAVAQLIVAGSDLFTNVMSNKEWRGAVVGDSTWASTAMLQNPAGQVYLAETLGWLTQDPALSGETETEEDVKIQHTKDGETVWFYGTIVLVPALVFMGGLFRVSRRRKGGAK